MNQINNKRRTVLGAGASLLVAAAMQGAYAQSRVGEQSPSDSSEEIKEIIVTAQRRAEKLQDVPISITVQTGEQLEAANVTNVRDLDTVVPGLRYGYSVNAIPAIRGVHTDQTDPGNDPNVSLYIDNVYQPDPQANNFNLPDVSRIEVLKGPQGTLFGRNATGGAIRVFTLEPSFTETGMVDVGYGNYNDVIAKAYLSGPIVGDTLAASVSGYYERADGYNRNVLTGDRGLGLDNKYLRLKLLAKFTDTLTANLIFGYFEHYDGNLGDWNVPDGNALARTLGTNVIIPSQPRQYASNVIALIEASGETASLKVDWDDSAGTLSSTTGFNGTHDRNNSDGDFSSLNLLSYPIHAQNSTVSQELTFSSKKLDEFQYTVGGFYYHSVGWYNPLGVAGAFVVPTLYGFMRQGTDAYAGFGELTYEPIERLTFIAGARYSYEKREAEGSYEITPAQPAVLPPIGTGEVSYNSTTPRASVRYAFPSDDNIYFTYSQGFKSGGFNISSLQATPFKPEKLDAYEVGIKTSPKRLFSGNFSAFYYDYTNQQEETFVNGFNVTSNAASSTIYGVDAEIVARPVQQFTLTTGISYLHARFNNYPGAVYDVPSGPPGCLCGNTTVTGDLSGKQIPTAPDFTISTAADYHGQTPIGAFDLSALYYYTSRIYLENSNRVSQGAYGTLALRASLQPTDTHLSVYVWGKNLTDRNYVVAEFVGAAGDGLSWGPPRTFGIGAKYDF